MNRFLRASPIWFFLVTVLLAGCSSVQNELTIPLEDSEPCFWKPRGQNGSVSIGPGAHVIRNPLTNGSMGNGGALHFPWLADGNDLRKVNITLTWQVPLGGQERLRLEVDDSDETQPSWRYKIFEGPSPLTAVIQVNGSADLGETLHLVIGTAREGPTPLGTVALVDQEVFVAVQQTYVC